MIWINAKERLPEESGEYLVILNGGHITDLSYSARHKLFNAFDFLPGCKGSMNDDVAYWTEIPELPEELKRKD